MPVGSPRRRAAGRASPHRSSDLAQARQQAVQGRVVGSGVPAALRIAPRPGVRRAPARLGAGAGTPGQELRGARRGHGRPRLDGLLPVLSAASSSTSVTCGSSPSGDGVTGPPLRVGFIRHLSSRAHGAAGSAAQHADQRRRPMSRVGVTAPARRADRTQRGRWATGAHRPADCRRPVPARQAAAPIAVDHRRPVRAAGRVARPVGRIAQSGVAEGRIAGWHLGKATSRERGISGTRHLGKAARA